MTKTKEKRSFMEIFLCMGIIMPPAFLFSMVADLPHVMIITLGGFILSLLSRKTAKLTDRTVIYSIVVSLVAGVLFDLAFPIADDRFEYISSLFRPNITVPVIFYLAVAVTFFGVKKYSYGIASVGAVIALAFCGNAMRIPFETQRFLVPETLLQSFNALYVSCISLSELFILLACRNNVQVKIVREMRKYRSRRFLMVIFIMALVFPTGYGCYKLIAYFESDLRGLQNLLLNPMFFKNRGGKTVFGERADLNQMISPELLKDQEAIVIRAISKDEPGYLRGKTYTSYSSGQWRQTKDPQEMTMRLRDSEGKDYRTFSINKKAKSKHSIEILISSKLVSKSLFLPGDFTQIDIIANSLRYTRDGNVSLEDWITDGGYTIYRSKNISDSSWPKPVKPDMAVYTQLPENIIKEIDPILAELPALKAPDTDDQKRIFILLKYFQDNFKYKIREQPANPIDPVLSFLKETHEGHCELYATSMILLLRRLGIPARYVTGFICAEPHPMGYYYVARVGNAHAWVEAFDRDKGKWLLIEPTPPSGAPNYKHEWSTVESWIDIIKKAFQQLLSNMRRGYFAQAIIGFFVAIWHFIVIIFWHSVRGSILTVITIALAIHYIRRWRKNRQVKSDFATPDEMFVELGKSYQKIQKQLKSKYELDLSISSTINDFVIELSKSEMPELQKISLIKLLRKYEAMRYQKTPPSQEVYQDFKNHFHL
jgi:transglutaminase-like putative cysteine protease